MRQRAEFAAALLALVVGAAVALIAATRTWQTFTTPRQRPLADDILQVSGRTIDAAPTALALVALAGVVAVLATRGVWRRLVGVVIAVAGVALVWRGANGFGAVGAATARRVVSEKHPSVTFELAPAPSIAVHSGWATLTIACGVLVALGGALVAWRGASWAAMSARYSRTPDPIEDAAAAQAKANASLWNSLDKGSDPTLH